HPRLTGYHILFFVLTVGFGMIKAYTSYKGQITTPVTMDWVYGILIVSLLYWLGLYKQECPGKLPPWIFETDLLDSLKGILTK
ncbi:hypothetical protein C8R43DRAFT_846903, partial [Mycena crocata]